MERKVFPMRTQRARRLAAASAAGLLMAGGVAVGTAGTASASSQGYSHSQYCEDDRSGWDNDCDDGNGRGGNGDHDDRDGNGRGGNGDHDDRDGNGRGGNGDHNDHDGNGRGGNGDHNGYNDKD